MDADLLGGLRLALILGVGVALVGILLWRWNAEWASKVLATRAPDSEERKRLDAWVRWARYWPLVVLVSLASALVFASEPGLFPVVLVVEAALDMAVLVPAFAMKRQVQRASRPAVGVVG